MFKNYNIHNNIVAGISLRGLDKNGKLIEEFSIGNVDYFRSDIIEKSRNKIAHHLVMPNKNIILGKQTHSDIIEIVDNELPNKSYDCDGLITTSKEVALLVSVADCIAVLIYDPVNNVIAAIHSGWRGTKQSITEKAVLMMKKHFGTKESNIRVQISAAASGEKYEVGEDVAVLFPDSIKPISSGKFLFDNKAEILKRLVDMNVPRDSISIDFDCTIGNQIFHSYRRDGVNSGRNAVFIKIV